jgi:hypothetical protein
MGTDRPWHNRHALAHSSSPGSLIRSPRLFSSSRAGECIFGLAHHWPELIFQHSAQKKEVFAHLLLFFCNEVEMESLDQRF